MRTICSVLAIATALTLLCLGCTENQESDSEVKVPQQTERPTAEQPGDVTDFDEPQTVVDDGTDTGRVEPAPGEQAAEASWGNAPDFSFTTFDGRAAKLSDFHGKPIVVNFWAAWCRPCLVEMPEFQEVYNTRKGQFELLGIAVDANGNPKSLVAEAGYTWIFGFDRGGFSKYSRRGAIPLTVFIDRNGNKVSQQVGAFPNRQQFERALEQIL